MPNIHKSFAKCIAKVASLFSSEGILMKTIEVVYLKNTNHI